MTCGWFIIKMWFYQYRSSHRGDKTILWMSYFHNGICYTFKTIIFLYWIKALKNIAFYNRTKFQITSRHCSSQYSARKSLQSYLNPLWLDGLKPWDVQTIGYKQRVLMHRHQGLNVRHGLCHIYMRYLYIYELFIAFVCFVVCSLL